MTANVTGREADREPDVDSGYDSVGSPNRLGPDRRSDAGPRPGDSVALTAPAVATLVGGRDRGVAYLAIRVLVAGGEVPRAVGLELEAALLEDAIVRDAEPAGGGASGTPTVMSRAGAPEVAAWLASTGEFGGVARD